MKESEIPKEYANCILQSPMILCCESSLVNHVQSMLPNMCIAYTKVQLILNLVFPAIEKQQLTRDEILKTTSILLEPREFYVLSNKSTENTFVSSLKSLKFLPTNQRGDLVSPCEVYDPTDDMIYKLFEGQNVFPITPFEAIHFSILKELGMKNSNTLCISDIIKVIKLICSHSDDQAKIKRASSLLEFLSTTIGSNLLVNHCSSTEFTNIICSQQWLPVITTPPEDYPKCLDWKGFSGSQFVSAQSLHASSSPEEHKKLPNLIGSQMKILQYEGTLSDTLLQTLNITDTVPLDSMIQQLLCVIKHKVDIDKQVLGAMVNQLYYYLQQRAKESQTSKHWQQLSQSEIIQVGDNKFVLPSVVACSFDEKCMTVGKLEPYWYILPDNLQQFKSLFCLIGAKEQVKALEVLSLLKKNLWFA